LSKTLQSKDLPERLRFPGSGPGEPFFTGS
jgi:hypothetical protein